MAAKKRKRIKRKGLQSKRRYALGKTRVKNVQLLRRNIAKTKMKLKNFQKKLKKEEKNVRDLGVLSHMFD